MSNCASRDDQDWDCRCGRAEEVLTEYLCDWPGCPNTAEHVVGVARDVALVSVLCPEHAREPKNGSSSEPSSQPSESDPPPRDD